MVGLVHNLCEPGFFGGSKFFEFDRWFLSTFGLLVIFVISSVFCSWVPSVFGAVGGHLLISVSVLVSFSLFAAWVAFVGL